ncbi:MAG: alpha/beta hydrolase [Alphaproteobacteria bacterium]|nr:alpha/beta hydrolase [Alphaproteobacteria bacterium]
MTDPSDSPVPIAAPSELAGTYRPADRWAYLASGGTRLRYALWNGPAEPRGTVLVLPGRTEFIEKYATEVVGELIDRGFAVAAFDWRGQGLSDRPLPDRDKGHIDRFETYIADLHLFLDTVLTPWAKPPVLGLAHSMGGHLFLRTLSIHGATPFAGALVSSPMMGLTRQGLLRAAILVMPSLLAIDTRYLPGFGPVTPASHKFDGNVVTHDERRFRFTEQWFAADPRLSEGGPTIGWARQALKSMAAALAPGVLERIDLPISIVSAGADTLVDIAAHKPVAARIASARHITIEGAKHEVMMEIDPLRAQFWGAFDRFTKEVIG